MKQEPRVLSERAESTSSILARLARFAGHADLRWHLWIALAAIGRLDVQLGGIRRLLSRPRLGRLDSKGGRAWMKVARASPR